MNTGNKEDAPEAEDLVQQPYLRQIERQIEQYADVDVIHDNPASHDYWQRVHMAPRFVGVFGALGLYDFYAKPLAEALALGRSNRIVSLGCGDARVESGIARRLLQMGVRDFEIVGVEISPHLLARAAARVATDEALASRFVFLEADVNEWKAESRLAGVIAHHTLHHFVGLECLFEQVYSAIGPDGVFVTCDMIGRNGHQRWPELLLLCNQIWETMPERYRYHHQFERKSESYEDIDCREVDFLEGVRAEEILGLLLDRFDCERFLGYGALMDFFTERSYGPNFDPENDDDQRILDGAQRLCDVLLARGALTPTQMAGVFRQRNSGPRARLYYMHQHPTELIRDPGCAPSPSVAESVAEGGLTFDALMRCPTPAEIGEGGVAQYQVCPAGRDRPAGLRLLSGWGDSEEKLVWTVAQTARLAILMRPADVSTISCSFLVSIFLGEGNKSQTVNVLSGRRQIGRFHFVGSEPRREVLQVVIPVSELSVLDGWAEFGFQFDEPRILNVEKDKDTRMLGLALYELVWAECD